MKIICFLCNKQAYPLHICKCGISKQTVSQKINKIIDNKSLVETIDFEDKLISYIDNKYFLDNCLKDEQDNAS
jgi:hypothetical protein